MNKCNRSGHECLSTQLLHWYSCRCPSRKSPQHARNPVCLYGPCGGCSEWFAPTVQRVANGTGCRGRGRGAYPVKLGVV